MLILAKALKFKTVALLIEDLNKPNSLSKPLVQKVCGLCSLLRHQVCAFISSLPLSWNRLLHS